MPPLFNTKMNDQELKFQYTDVSKRVNWGKEKVWMIYRSLEIISEYSEDD